MALQFGIGFGQDSKVHEIGDQVRIAEDAGFTHATFIDMGLVTPDVYVMMTLICANTSRIQIGQGVTDPITHNPAVIANAAATLRELSGGRAFVGIGVGGPYGKPFMRRAKLAELLEAIRFIKAYTAGEEAQIFGYSWHSEWIRQSQYAGLEVPVYVAVCGPGTCRVAGEVGDAAFSIGIDPILQRWRKEVIEKAAVDAGRDPEAVDLWVRTQVYLADSKEAAFRETAPYAATCAWELYQVLLRKTPETEELARRIERHHPGLIDEFKAIYDAWDPYYTERIGGPQTKVTTQRVIDFFLATGTVDEVGGRLAALDGMGLKGIWTVLYSIQDQVGMMQAIGRSLIRLFA